MSECKKIYIQRDYSQALIVRFSTEFPEEFENYIDRQIWFDFVNDLNQIYAEADKLTPRAYFENILGLLTCHLSRLCLKSQWTIKLEEVKALIDDANQQHFVKNGLYVCNPVEKGFRVIEVVLLEEPLPTSVEVEKPAEKNIQAPAIAALQPR